MAIICIIVVGFLMYITGIYRERKYPKYPRENCIKCTLESVGIEVEK